MAIEDVWECECGSEYDNYDDARQCCEPVLREFFRCSVCLTETDHFPTPADHSEGCEGNAVTQKELEEAGQQRLFEKES